MVRVQLQDGPIGGLGLPALAEILQHQTEVVVCRDQRGIQADGGLKFHTRFGEAAQFGQEPAKGIVQGRVRRQETCGLPIMNQRGLLVAGSLQQDRFPEIARPILRSRGQNTVHEALGFLVLTCPHQHPGQVPERHGMGTLVQAVLQVLADLRDPGGVPCHGREDDSHARHLLDEGQREQPVALDRRMDMIQERLRSWNAVW